MNDKEHVLAMLTSHEKELRSLGVLHAALFGSLARGDATQQSDIDVLIELDPTAPIGAFAYAGIKRYISELFSKPVDVVNRKALKPSLQHPVIDEAIHVF